MTKVALEVGKTYKVNHSRKGKFCGRVESLYGEFATMTVTAGKAGAMLPENVAETGEQVTVRVSHITSATPVEAA